MFLLKTRLGVVSAMGFYKMFPNYEQIFGLLDKLQSLCTIQIQNTRAQNPKVTKYI